ncbi:MAG: PadR family transcriptional regulator [Lachnospiraceae bacterium]|nr:PadR family transcriptional regulator [Lachnospiraceae bacterium]
MIKIGSCTACQGQNLDKFVQPVILSVLKKQGGLNGFQMVKAMEEYETFKSATPDPSGIYRYLKAMAEKNLLDQKKTEDGKCIYFITDEGLHCLENWKETISDYVRKIQVLQDQIQ